MPAGRRSPGGPEGSGQLLEGEGMVRKNSFRGGLSSLAGLSAPLVVNTSPHPSQVSAKSAPAQPSGPRLKVASRDAISTLLVKSRPLMLPKPSALVTHSQGSLCTSPAALLSCSTLPEGRAQASSRHCPVRLMAPPAPIAQGRREAGLVFLGTV